jgi:probable biosynthetic protein (TIGR04098 family)
MTYDYDLSLGLPHTNARGLWEPLLLMHSGHFQWNSLARAIGVPLSRLRTISGGEVYATFYYVEEVIPDSAPLESYGLDDVVRFKVGLRAFKNLSVEGRIVFDRPERLEGDTDANETRQARPTHPSIHFGNIFITPAGGNSLLRVAPPANGDFTTLPPLPNAENPYHLTKAAATTGSLQLFDDGWSDVSGPAPFELHYRIDPDRDTNGAGLVYFANYVVFMEIAERSALDLLARGVLPGRALASRSLRQRRIGYYGNVDTTDSVRIEVRVFINHRNPRLLGLRFVVRRAADQAVICLSEAVKAIELE